MITVKHLQKSFVNDAGTRVTVLKDVNCQIADGEIISIIGPSGAGKSTFLHALNALDPPTGGEILLDGENTLARRYPTHKLRRRMGMVFQNFNLFENMTVLENVCLAPRHLLHLSKEEAEKEGMALLRKVGMADKASYGVSQLSSGQKQRVAIARCLGMKPEVILLDEPTSALDPTMVGEVLGVIRQLAREEKITMVIVTHKLDFAREVSSRIFFMDEGVIIEEGTPQQVFDHPAHSATRAFVQRIRKLKFDISNEDFDYYDMNSQMHRFCIKYNIPGKFNAIQYITEEMTRVVLKDVRPMRVALNHSELTGETSLYFMKAGITESPITEDSDQLALDIVRGMSRGIVEEPTKLGYRVKVLV